LRTDFDGHAEKSRQKKPSEAVVEGGVGSFNSGGGGVGRGVRSEARKREYYLFLMSEVADFS
jgi:hypothetical protein